MGADRLTIALTSWIGEIFAWQRPKFGFSAAEQPTLVLAMRGRKDDEIGAICGVSAATVLRA